ncbi:MAG: hypothetical protein LBG52_01950 [Candidatus Peribacteria bacterium]|jgi:hypothetical protein|nr:hypothetical protein [Candidatus Peribacteria bacterium]
METTVIKTRRDSTANWQTQNPALAEGEIGIEILTSGEKKLKI